MSDKNFFLGTYQKLKDSKRLSQVLILLSFLLTFALVRLVTHLQRWGYLPNQQGPTHIHHLVPGIIFLLISGYFGISFWNIHKIRSLMAIIFGIGAALTIDEFALWLFLKDVYWERQRRDSIDAVIITIIIFTLLFFLSEAHDHIWLRKLFRKVPKM